MRILYVGQLKPGGTCLDRMHALQRLGHELIGVNQAACESRIRLLRSIQWRLHPRWMLQEFNQNILKAAESVADLDVVWVDKGTWVFPETIDAIKRKHGCLLVHYTPDAQLLINRSKHFVESIGIYDHLITTKRFEVEMYRFASAKSVVVVTQSYCPVRFAKPRQNDRYSQDIGFISDYKPHYGRIIRLLSSRFHGIGVWGPGWRRAALLGRVPGAVIKGDDAWGEAYVEALASFKIGLGLLSKYIPEQHTTRSLEIPAAGSFLLAERTDEHLELFQEGEEAEFFTSVDELVDKARFYLANETARLRIAQQGRLRCATSGYDTDTVMRRIIEVFA